MDTVFALILFLHFFLNFRKTEFAAATLICCQIILLHNEKKIFFLEVSTDSDGDLYLLINEDITLSLLDKYFFAAFQYFGFLLMPISRWYFLFVVNFSSKNY